MKRKKLIIGSRGSKLALWQANYIAGRLREAYPETEVVIEKMLTTGDKILDVPLAKIGGKGLFTKELEQAMLEKEIDFCWSGNYVFHYLIGDISLAAERNELWSLWERNFMEYLSMGIYRVTVTVESC